MPKKDTTATPAPPSDQQTDRPGERKTLTIELAPASATLLRRLSAKTGLTQAHLRAELSRSVIVAEAVEKALKKRYDNWKEGLGDDLFGPEKGEGNANG